MSSLRIVVATGLAAVLLSWPMSRADAKPPKFEFVEPPEKVDDGVEWKASAQAGLLMTTGNSSATTISSGFRTSRKSGRNKLALDLAGAFARATIFVATDQNGNGVVDEPELERLTKTTTESWLAKLRYDRFLSSNNAVYASATASADEPAGKRFTGSGQLGYSRTLVKNEVHDIVAEAGYDLSYEDLLGQSEVLSIHSIRSFLGYEGKLSPDTGLAASFELLFNMNELDTVTGAVRPFQDARFYSSLSLTTKIYGDMSFRFAFRSKYDNAPAPRPALKNLPYAADFHPVADRLDTRTEAAIIVNFL
jgi:hypothetical protein